VLSHCPIQIFPEGLHTAFIKGILQCMPGLDSVYWWRAL